MGINCVLFQARYWLISFGTAPLVSSNSLSGGLHLWASGMHTCTVPGTMVCGLRLAGRAPLGTHICGDAQVMSPLLYPDRPVWGEVLGECTDSPGG